MSLLPVSTDLNLVLTGSIGPNQIIVARRIAERLKLRFVDAEREVEKRAEMLPSQFQTLFGDARLRALESEVINDLALYRGAVIHISGQTLSHGDNLARMLACSYVVCLVASIDAVLTRLHIALGARYHNPAERALTLGILRRDWSIRGRDPRIHEFDTTALTDGETIEQIAALWADKVIEFTKVS
jgi:shikimate kinase